MPEQDEVQLIEQAQNGSEEAFKQLVLRYQRRVYWIAYNILNDYDYAQDIGQEAFIRAYRSLKNFSKNRSFYTWLYRIVVNLCIDYLRSKSDVKLLQVERMQIVSEGNPLDNADTTESLELIKKAVRKLPVKYRTVLTLRDIQGFNAEEIGEILDCSSATIRWRIHKARQMFRNIWTRKKVEAEQDE